MSNAPIKRVEYYLFRGDDPGQASNFAAGTLSDPEILEIIAEELDHKRENTTPYSTVALGEMRVHFDHGDTVMIRPVYSMKAQGYKDLFYITEKQYFLSARMADILNTLAGG